MSYIIKKLQIMLKHPFTLKHNKGIIATPTYLITLTLMLIICSTSAFGAAGTTTGAASTSNITNIDVVNGSKSGAISHIAIPNVPTSRVLDLANLLNQPERRTLNTKLRNIHQSSGVEIQLLTIPSLNGEVIEDVALNVGRKWKLGRSGMDNGVLILVAAAERKYRVEVGYGLEGSLPDGYIGRIGRQVLAPNLKNGAYYQGLNLFIDNLTQQINKSSGANNSNIASNETQASSNNANSSKINLVEALGGAVGFIIICLMVAYINQKKSRLPNGAYNFDNHTSQRQKRILVIIVKILRSILIGIILSKIFGSKGGSGSSKGSDDIGSGGGFGGGGSSGKY
jgi:uncharacterized protein